MHPSPWTSQTAHHCPACCWPAAAASFSLLGLCDGQRGKGDIYMYNTKSLKLQLQWPSLRCTVAWTRWRFSWDQSELYDMSY